jgi:queuine tRNA-ribosyltransferase
MTEAVTFALEATDGLARAGTATTPHGSFATPAFMVVGTRGAVRTLDASDLDDLDVAVVLANTYHLMLKPGAEVVAELGGLHRFTGWSGPMLTDSGGFQVFSLLDKPGPGAGRGRPGENVKLDDDGVTFKSTYDGSSHRLTAERAVAIQELLGADIQMALDVCASLPGTPIALRSAVERTLAWAARARAAHTRPDQALFGIVQGGTDPALRAESASRTAAIGFDGYAVGGLSVGESRAEMGPALAAATAELPTRQLRYLMGVGDPARLVDAVGLGIDIFDCVLPTRHGRHGTVLADGGQWNLKNARFTADDRPLDPACACSTCARWSRGYLRHLLTVQEPTAGRLVTIHNIAWLQGFVRSMGEAVRAGRFATFRDEVLRVWR